MHIKISSIFFCFLFLGCVFLPFSPSPDDGGVISYGMPFLMLGSLFSLALFLNHCRYFNSVEIVLSFLFLFFIVSTSLISAEIARSMVRATANIIGFLIFLGVLYILRAQRFSLDHVARLFLLSGFCLAAYFIFNFVYKSFVLGFEVVVLERYVGGAMSLPWGASNSIAQTLLLSFIFFLLISEKRFLDYLFILVVGLAICLTFSRSVTAFAVLMSLVVIGFWRSCGVFALAAILAAVFVSFGALDFSGFETFVSSRIDPEKILTGNGRVAAASEKLEYFWSNPISPVGYYSSLNYFELSAHNYWITTLVEQSILSVCVSFALFMYVGLGALVYSARVACAFLIVMLALLVEDPHFTQPYIVTFWLLLAVLVFCGRVGSSGTGVRNESSR